MPKKGKSPEIESLRRSLQDFVNTASKIKEFPPKNREFKRLKDGLEFDLKKAGFDEESAEWVLVFGDPTFHGTGFFKDPAKQAEFEKIEYKKDVEALEDGASALLKRLPA
jgi:hypothetical protein